MLNFLELNLKINLSTEYPVVVVQLLLPSAWLWVELEESRLLKFRRNRAGAIAEL